MRLYTKESILSPPGLGSCSTSGKPLLADRFGRSTQREYDWMSPIQTLGFRSLGLGRDTSITELDLEPAEHEFYSRLGSNGMDDLYLEGGYCQGFGR
jgi:hypothetical protein